MILFDLCGESESDPIYQELEVSNGNRQYDFLLSLVKASLATDRPFLSQHVLRALNFQAIVCLHDYAGVYRPCDVVVGAYKPPPPFRVPGLMEDFVNYVNRSWETADPIVLAAFVLWRLNHIHPFINGNGRTARAASYFVLCVKLKQWLPGTTILPELLRRERPRYVDALQKVDASVATGTLNLQPLVDLMGELLYEQVSSPSGASAGAVPVVPALPAPPSAPCPQ